VILEDLATLMTQAIAGAALRLPARTAPARAWARALVEAAATTEVAASTAHWQAVASDPAAMDGAHAAPEASAGTRETVRTRSYNRDAAVVTVELDPQATRQLVQDAARRLESPVHSLLLAALLVAWCEWQGADALTLDLEGHGRDALGESLDVSRTVGWFTTVFPVRLALPPTRGDERSPALDRVVRAVRTTLDALPLRGATHGMLRYLSSDASIRAGLAAMPRPALLFNYLGTFDLSVPESSGLRVTNESSGRTRDPDAERPYPLEINARLQDGRLVVTIEFARTQHAGAAIDRLARALRSSLDAIARTASPQFDATALETIAALLDDLDQGDGADDDPADGGAA
jgi:non-ribosomal peptide synthase protein (TIGR01720 family)